MVSNYREAVDRALEAWNRHDLDSYLELYSPEVEVTGLLPGPVGIEGMRSFYQNVFSAFPDMRLEQLDTVCEGDKMAVHFRVSGTHQGEFQGTAATGRTVRIEGMTLLYFQGKKVVRRAGLFDELRMLQQLGVIPG